MTRMRAMERDELHGPWPTLIEQVQSAYPEWDISRELRSDGTHGDWRAQRGDSVITAPTPDLLRMRLAHTAND